MIIFSKHCHVETDGCKRCLSNQDVALLRMLRDGNLDIAHHHTYTLTVRGVKEIISEAAASFFLSLSFLSCCGSREYNTRTSWICRPQSLCSASHGAMAPPQIPPRSQGYPALSHTYCSVAYLVKPANIRSLLQGPFYPLIL